jgi:hypothetical protein
MASKITGMATTTEITSERKTYPTSYGGIATCVKNHREDENSVFSFAPWQVFEEIGREVDKSDKTFSSTEDSSPDMEWNECSILQASDLNKYPPRSTVLNTNNRIRTESWESVSSSGALEKNQNNTYNNEGYLRLLGTIERLRKYIAVII